MERLGNAATPSTGVTVSVPESTAPAVPVPDVIAMLMLPVKSVAGFPRASRAVTWTAGAMTWMAGVLVGCTVKARWVAGPLFVKGALWAGVIGPDVAARV